MQLFVMPVTTRLLTTPNRALEVEFSFAMEHHIPGLPLMQEGGLEDLFNKKCGDLQFLDKTARDSTAISYEEKLEKYLASVLVGDELAQKVRDAFDAYIFLSYRKKDRKYAQELMRLIHKNDFCRDIAIWYDEFLTPGENFNHAIKDALQKSNLFALVVTPNLVNETNYVMTTEYPEAKKCGKEVFPAQMVPTDEEQLKEKFEAIPKCVDARVEDELTASLMDALSRLAIRPTQSNPQHNFFIGLAYLNGIDVEVDRDRALKLITGAAKDKLPEAMKKLADMYWNGDGVERDCSVSVKWQETFALKLSFKHRDDKSQSTTVALMQALLQLGDNYYTLGRMDEAWDAYRQLNDIAQAASTEEANLDAMLYLASAYERMGKWRMDAYKEANDAIWFYQESIKIREKLREEKDEDCDATELAVCYQRLGYYQKVGKKYDEALISYEKSLEICKRAKNTGYAVRSDLLADIFQRNG